MSGSAEGLVHSIGTRPSAEPPTSLPPILSGGNSKTGGCIGGINIEPQGRGFESNNGWEVAKKVNTKGKGFPHLCNNFRQMQLLRKKSI